MKIFIGSSKEALPTANYVKSMLIHLGHDAILWKDTGVFTPSNYTLENLEELSEKVDAAVFIFSEDDLSKKRNTVVKSVRDNVLVEMGIFVGKLGRKNVALYVKGNPEIPTDLKGFTVINMSNNMDADKKEFATWIDGIPNSIKSDIIYMSQRQNINLDNPIEKRWKYAKEIVFVNYANTAFIANAKAVPSYVAKASLRKLYQTKVSKGCNFKFLITEPDSYADFDASLNKMNVVPNNSITITDIIRYAYFNLKNDCSNFSGTKGSIEFKMTTVSLPYSLVLITNDENHSNLDHIKVDLYSPYLASDNERRSFVVYRNNANFDFFYNQITLLWNHAHKPDKEYIFNAQKIESKDIKTATKKYYRQYLVGNLQKEQYLNSIYDSKIELGISEYQEFSSDKPHSHEYATEYLYVLQGEYKICVNYDGKLSFVSLKSGDFYTIPKNTQYASKAIKGTKVLFVKAPGINDKKNCEENIFCDFLKSWD